MASQSYDFLIISYEFGLKYDVADIPLTVDYRQYIHITKDYFSFSQLSLDF